MQAVNEYCRWCRDHGLYVDMVRFLDSVPLDQEEPFSQEDRFEMDSWRLSAFVRLHDWKLAMPLALALIQHCPRSRTYLDLMCTIGFIRRHLACYDSACVWYARARDYGIKRGLPDGDKSRAILLNLCANQCLSTRASYVSGKENEALRCCRLCGHVDIGTSLILCTCQRAWYCSPKCQEADVPRHSPGCEYRMPLDLLPTGVVQNILLPLCIIPLESDLRNAHFKSRQEEWVRIIRTHALGLRTLSVKWRNHVDSCRTFWFNVVPHTWPVVMQPSLFAHGLISTQALRQYVFETAQRVKSKARHKRRLALAKSVVALGESIDTLKRKLAEEEQEKAAAEAELSTLEADSKKPKK